MDFKGIFKLAVKLGLICSVALFAATTLAVAAEKVPLSAPKISFRGVEITPFDVFFIVRKDVNVRSLPTQKSKKVGRLDEGDRISGVGRAKKDWIAYRDQGKDIGFVYEPVLYPVIDSSLTQDLSGHLSDGNQPACDYKITFVGKTEAEGQLFLIGDYEVDWDCKKNAKKANFTTPMFLTEGPYISRHPAVHQLTIDILDLAINLEEVLSTNLYFDHEKMLVIYENVSKKRLAKVPSKTEIPVRSIPEALKAAVEFAYEAWNETLWDELMKRRP